MKEKTLFEFLFGSRKQYKIRLNLLPKIDTKLLPFLLRAKTPYRKKKIQFGRYVLEFFDTSLQSQIIHYAIDALKAQDIQMNTIAPSKPTPKYIVSLETYEKMQNDPAIAQDISIS